MKRQRALRGAGLPEIAAWLNEMQRGRYWRPQRAAFGGSIDPLDAGSAPDEIWQGPFSSEADALSLGIEPSGAWPPNPEFLVAGYANGTRGYCHFKCNRFAGNPVNIWRRDANISDYWRCMAHCMGTGEWPEMNDIVGYGEGKRFPKWRTHAG